MEYEFAKLVRELQISRLFVLSQRDAPGYQFIDSGFLV